jgi:hypothetical protein
VVEWRTKNDDFSNYIQSITKKSHFYTSKYYGGLLINADWILPDRYVPKWTNEKITVMTQPFRKIRAGFYLAEDWKKQPVTCLFLKKIAPRRNWRNVVIII